ncbi:hypothetical protein Tco_0401000 [Tanacetum coccineum]
MNVRTRSLGESEETPLEETNSLEGQCIELGNGISLWMIVVEDSRLIKSSQGISLAHFAKEAHVDVEKAQKKRGFILKALTKLAQAVTSKE